MLMQNGFSLTIFTNEELCDKKLDKSTYENEMTHIIPALEYMHYGIRSLLVFDIEAKVIDRYSSKAMPPNHKT